MSTPALHPCHCPACQQTASHPDQAGHRQMHRFLSRLDEAHRRWHVGLEADRLGHGGDRLLAQITGLDAQALRRGRTDLAAETEHLSHLERHRPTATNGHGRPSGVRLSKPGRHSLTGPNAATANREPRTAN